MIAFPNCKINLGLHVIRKRGDGYHEIETLFYPVALTDILEIVVAGEAERQYGDIHFTTSGILVEGNPDSNLCVQAYHLLKKEFPGLGGIKMHLHKTIPSGAGLGGGSSDASFALKLLNTVFDLRLSDKQLRAYALQLGSDCPFFLVNKPCLAMGRGEELERMDVDLSKYKFILINPAIHIHTANAFAQTTPALPPRPIKEIIRQPVSHWKDQLKNDFEKAAFKQFPEIKKIKDELYNAGAFYASMSGSGSTVYGIFEKEKKTSFTFPSHYVIRETKSV